MALHGDFSSIANCQTKMPMRGYFKLFVVCQNFYLFIPQFLMELWLLNTDLTKQGILSTDSVTVGVPLVILPLAVCT